MEIKARELSKSGALRSYLVVLREVKPGPDGQPEATVRTICYTAMSWSHVAAMYDRPESGVEILKQEFLAPGECSVLPLAYKAQSQEIIGDLSGLKMCYACEHDFRMNRVIQSRDGPPIHEGCHYGHRVDGDKATTICKGFSPKVR
jgi:hypothetical protein